MRSRRVGMWGRRRRDAPAPHPYGCGAGRSGSERADVRGLRALLALGNLELDPLVLVQAAVPRGLDRGEVGEDVRAAVVRGDEAEALVRVEPLHNAGNHVRLLDGRSFPAIMDGNEVIRPAVLRVSCCRTDRPYRKHRGYDKERLGQNPHRRSSSTWQTKLTTLGA